MVLLENMKNDAQRDICHGKESGTKWFIKDKGAEIKKNEKV